MKKREIIGSIILGGLLMKILHNQKVLDNHIERNTKSNISYDETIEYNSLRNKIGRKIYKLFNKE